MAHKGRRFTPVFLALRAIEVIATSPGWDTGSSQILPPGKGAKKIAVTLLHP